MSDFEPKLSRYEPEITAIARGEVGGRALKQQYPASVIHVAHEPDSDRYYRYSVIVDHVRLFVVFGADDILNMNGKGLDAWGSEFVGKVKLSGKMR